MVWHFPGCIVKILRTVSLGFLLLLLSCPTHARLTGTRLPFRLSNNLIIVDASINGSDTLHFILESGLKTSIICELSAGESLHLGEVREIQVNGPGTSYPAEAFHSTGNSIGMGDTQFNNCDFIVLSTNRLGLSNKMGTKIHGMLSMNVFYGYLVEINYETKFITLKPPANFTEENLTEYIPLPIRIESGKPFIDIIITIDDNTSYPVKLLLDSGVSNALWLDIKSMDGLNIPENNIRCYLGCGISGDVEGRISRIRRVEIGPYKLTDVLVSFPDSAAIVDQGSIIGRNGSLGADILMRFDILLDLSGEKIYLRPNGRFSQKFHHDMSGIEVLSQVPDLPVFLISRVLEDSPACKAGISAGDEILRIDNTPAAELTMDIIYRHLSGPDGRKIRMQILRSE